MTNSSAGAQLIVPMRPRRGPRPLLRVLAVASCGAAASAVLSWWPKWVDEFPLGVIYVLVVSSFAASGAFLLADSHTGRTGWYMIIAAFCYEASWWWIWPETWEVGPAPLVSFVIGYWWFAIGGLALLRYPEPSLGYRHERVYFIGFAIWIVGLKLFIATVSEPEWSGWSPQAWWPTVAANEQLFRISAAVFKVGTIVFALALPLLLVFKIRRTRGAERADTLPATLAAMAIGIIGGVYLIAQLGRFNAHLTDALRTITAIAALIAPLAFLVSLTQRRLARSSVADLVLVLAGCSTLTEVQQALRDVLGDPTLVLAMRDEGPLHYVTCDGHQLTDDEASGWRVPMPGDDGRPVAMLLMDHSLRRRADLVRSAAVAGGLLLENGLLKDSLAAQLVELQKSRRRIAEAGLAERRRIERNLHDGAQQLLLRVASRLSIAQYRSRQGRDASEAIAAASSELDLAQTELRVLAQGLHSPVLAEFGLKSAIEGVASRLSVAAVLDVTTTRLSESVESTVYFVVCEALTNVVKHARANVVDISVSVDGEWVRTRISDDGQGGADSHGGSGLLGIHDRVDALRGHTSVLSRPGHGTTIMAVIPCA